MTEEIKPQQNIEQSPISQMQSTPKKEWYKTCLGAGIAFIFLPFFITWYVWAKTRWSIPIKLAITIPIAFFVFLIMLAGSDPSSTKTDEKSSQIQSTLQHPAGIAAPEEKKDTQESDNQSAQEVKETAPALTYNEVDSYEKAGHLWKMIVFSKTPTTNELIDAAVALHKKDDQVYYHLFDNGEKIVDYKNWDINYGKVIDKDGKTKDVADCLDIAYCSNLVKEGKYAYPYPTDFELHELAIINEMFTDGGMKWQLSSSLGEKISDL